MFQENDKIHCSIKIWFTNSFLGLNQAMKNPQSSSGQGRRKIGENFGVEPDDSQK